ncbi:MAG: VanZ family protein [Lachnospiraceae bacterium]
MQSLLISYISQDWHMVKEYLHSGIIVGIGAWLCYMTYSICFYKKARFPKSIVFYFFAVYVHVLYRLTLLSRPPGSRTSVALKLFATFTGDLRGMMYVVENVLMFVPLGILLPIIWEKQRKGYVLLLTAFFSSVAIEVTQFLTQRGYCQTDDVMTNTIGAGIGFLIFQIGRYGNLSLQKCWECREPASSENVSGRKK